MMNDHSEDQLEEPGGGREERTFLRSAWRDSSHQPEYGSSSNLPVE